tara:strand:+ start:196 stop:1242 length:1047 start_codon:yes stop_codon:yes gene_type:complete
MHHKVIFRCDAGHAPEIGTGHIARSKTLANELVNSKLLSKDDIIFLTRDDPGFDLGKKYLKKSGFNFEVFADQKLKANSDSEKYILCNANTKIIFMDRLETSENLIKSISARGIKVVTFDDYGDGRNFSDLAISSIFDDVTHSLNLITGYKYLILSKNVYKKSIIRNNVSNIVATFGGNDARDLCLHFLKNIEFIDPKIKIEIILGKVEEEDIYRYKNIVKERLNNNIDIHIFPNNYHEIIANADFAISSGGLSIFEFSAYGVPSIGLPQYPHQLRTIKNLEKAGISILGTLEMNLSNNKLSDAIKMLISDNALRKKMAIKCRDSIDGNGVERIKDILKVKFKGVFYE